MGVFANTAMDLNKKYLMTQFLSGSDHDYSISLNLELEYAVVHRQQPLA